jgi:hypothetical protein
MDQLIKTIRKVMPAVVTEINEKRIPALESSWGRPFKEEMANENQVTVEIAKAYARPVNNTLYRHVKQELKGFQEHTTDGSDYIFEGTLIEDKNSFSPGPGWVGNGFAKTDWHMLKKFGVNDNGRITSVFIALVDLSKCQAAWSERQSNTNRSTIDFRVEDYPHINVVVGSVKMNRVKLKPIPQNILDL